MLTEQLTVEASEFQDHFYEAGWTDGLPVVPPTAAAVQEMLAGAQADGAHVVGSLADPHVDMSAEHAAIAAVMAGCRPDYFPVVLAALSASLDAQFNLPVVCTSTGGSAICVVVSGPLAGDIGMNAGHGALGSGNRANATIGRAVRLAATNLLRTQAEGTDGTSLGHPGRLSFCFAETQTEGWSSLREQLGYGRDDTTVTVTPALGPIQVANHLNAQPEAVVASLAAAMRVPSAFTTGKGASQFVVVVGPEHRAALVAGGVTRSSLSALLRQQSRIAAHALEAAGILLERDAHHPMLPDGAGELATVASDDDILVVAAGGEGAGWSAVIPSWAPKKHAQAVTRRIPLPGEPLPTCGADACEVDWTALSGHA
ncbi:MAG: hypothetical protein JWP14_79 [Frankiales bacterium]|nr:hypothetical protein [Frankiales bacterium]